MHKKGQNIIQRLVFSNCYKVIKTATTYRYERGVFEMKNTTHRVVILNNVNSDIISQAILILKNSEGVCEASVLEEAERVVEKYMQNGGVLQGIKRGSKKGMAIAVATGVTLVLIASMVMIKLGI